MTLKVSTFIWTDKIVYMIQVYVDNKPHVMILTNGEFDCCEKFDNHNDMYVIPIKEAKIRYADRDIQRVHKNITGLKEWVVKFNKINNPKYQLTF